MLRATIVIVGVMFGLSLVSGARAQDDVDLSATSNDSLLEENPEISSIPREIIPFNDLYSPGTILVRTGERRLYYVLPGRRAIKYGVGVGRPGFAWTGVSRVSAKREWPDWTPPPEMLERRPDLPDHMDGGLDNPLGARALYIAGTLFRIHGSNEPETIGHAVSSGCIRMTNQDVIDLYNRVKIGSPVVVQR